MAKETYYVANETYYMAKETYYMTKKTYYMAKETYHAFVMMHLSWVIAFERVRAYVICLSEYMTLCHMFIRIYMHLSGMSVL